MSRRSDRKHSFSLIFQLEFHSDLDIDQCAGAYFDGLEPGVQQDSIDKVFVVSEFRGVSQNKAAIDRLIERFSEGWSVSRLSKTDLAILRLCVYEMMFVKDIPHSVSINEAVELAKCFSSDEAPAFVNGILGKIENNIEVQ